MSVAAYRGLAPHSGEGGTAAIAGGGVGRAVVAGLPVRGVAVSIAADGCMATHGACAAAVAGGRVSPARAIADLSCCQVPVVVATRRKLALHRGGGSVSIASCRLGASEDVALLPRGRILVAISTGWWLATAGTVGAVVVAIASRSIGASRIITRLDGAAPRGSEQRVDVAIAA